MKAFQLALVLLSFANFSVFAAEGKKEGDQEAAARAAKQQEMMKAFMEYSTPGPQHAMLKGLAGNWKVEGKMWEAEGAPAQSSTGSSKMTMIMGGRYLQQNFKGRSKEMNMNFDGLGFIGYDNQQKQFQTLWIDSMATGMMHGSGAYDDATKTMTDNGSFTCPITKGTRTYRSEWKMIDKNKTVFSMFTADLASGKEYKMMELNYSRAK